MEEASGETLPKGFCDETTCSICLDYFKDPVMIPECGHNFCRTCLDQWWGESNSEISCPQCRLIVKERKVTPNRPLANLIDITKKLTLGGEKRARDERGICGKHQEPQKFFCQDDKVLICMVCDRSKEHRNHQVIPLEEASEEYKDQIKNHLTALRRTRVEVLSYKANTEKESQGLLDQVKIEKEKTMKTFRQLHHVLEEQEKLLLAHMEEAMEEIERKRKNHVDKLEGECHFLERIIQEMEGKLQQPAADLLHHIGHFMERCKAQKNCENSSITFPDTLKWKIWDFCDINPFLEGITKEFKDSLVSGLQLQKVNVHLDPATAQAKLIVSKNCRSVRWTETWQDVPDNPERFDFSPCVLGCEDFKAGRHFWEIFVGPEGSWSVGVAKKSVRRKGIIKWELQGDIWYLGKGPNTFWSSGNTSHSPLSLSEEPRKIRVSLNCEGGRVAFHDADRGTLICAYSGAPFARETLCPFYYVCGNGHLWGQTDI